MGTGPFFYGKKSLTPERQRNGTSGLISFGVILYG